MKKLLSGNLLRWATTTITALLIAVTPAWPAPPTYSLTPLGLVSTLFPCDGGALTPAGSGINDSGRVTGIYCAQNGTPQGEVRGFLWTPQLGAVDLGLPPGVTDPTTIVKPFGINARGQIVGEVANSSFDDDFVWDRSGFTLIAADAQALAINNPGQVTGRLYSPGHAFLYSNGAVMDLGVGVPGATESGGDAINNLGHIAGWAGIPAPAPAYVSIVPMVWTGAAWRVLGKPIAGDDYAYPSSINNFDEIVGVSNSNNSPMHAFLWKDGVYTVLPCLPDQYCAASSINDAGTIVGATNTVGVIWFGGQPYDINTLIDPNDPLRGQVKIVAAGGSFIGLGGSLNARGEILTEGIYTSGPNNGQFEVFVLSPNDTVAQQ